MRNYPALFFAAMSSFLKWLISGCVFFLCAGSGLINAAPQGFVEGHLKIISPREVELADETPSEITAQNYADYRLVILSRDQHTAIANVTADENGNYRVALPPGNYVLDIQDRSRRHVRATPQPFTIVANQTVQIDMTIDTGVR